LYEFTTNVKNVCHLQPRKLQPPGASQQGEDLDCGGVAAMHYKEVGTPKPCHQQRSEAVV